MQSQGVPSEGIASRASVCIVKFDSITNLTNDDSQLQDLKPSLEDQNARFKVYIKNMGADRTGKGSLEFRLRDSSNIRMAVNNFLDSLLSLLDDAANLLRNPEVSEDLEDLDRSTDMEDIILHIGRTITSLMRLSIAIQSSAPHRRFVQSHDTRVYQKVDIDHVSEKYRKSDKQLQQRLGKANSYRRQYLKYREDHHNRIAHGSDADTEAQSTVASSISQGLNSEALGLEQLSLGYEDPAGEFSSQSTIYDASQFGFPKIPPMSKHGPFECPFCYMIIVADSQKAWEKHLINDIRPYMCLDYECPITEHYQTRRKWIEHMRQKHWQTWICPEGCQKVFNSSKEFRSHIMKLHPEMWRSKGWDPNFENACSRPLAVWGKENCPFCLDAIITSAFEYKKHVGDHQLDLARFVLPRIPAQDEPIQEEPAQKKPTADEPSPAKSAQDLQSIQTLAADESTGDPTAGPPSDRLPSARDIKGKSVERRGNKKGTRDVHLKSNRKNNKKPSSSSSSANIRWICGECNAGNLSHMSGGCGTVEALEAKEKEPGQDIVVGASIAEGSESWSSRSAKLSADGPQQGSVGNKGAGEASFPWMRLPNEVKLAVLDILVDETVPTGMVYHLSSMAWSGQTSDWGSRPLYVVQQFIPLAERTPTQKQQGHLGSPVNRPTRASFRNYALMNSEYRNFFYARFYGRNTFCFNVSVHAILCTTCSRDASRFRSDTRVLPDINSREQPLGPLSGHAARFLQHATLVVAVPATPRPADLDDLSKLLERVAGLWKGGDKSLRTLHAHLAIAEKPGPEDGSLRVDALHIDADPRTSGLQITIQDLQREPPALPRRLRDVERVLAPLTDLRGLQGITTTGAVSEEFLRGLRAATVDGNAGGAI
ncbi:hypothetical protein PGQ11_007519 [Apiospora arundinis]|uniref:C2H2-type domain-containing protein n=1 Tax=Apiospora arundinis TaxID=335852 RepID=A0ABR2IVU5_9PEZI